MFKHIRVSGRFMLLKYFVIWFLAISFLLRLSFMLWQFGEVSWSIGSLLRTLFTGFFFDLGTAAFICIAPAIYFAVMPNKWVGSLGDRIITAFFTALNIFIITFSFFAEVTFWEEFKTRFNFIAVDYLIYTYEVIANINQSYPLPLLIGGILLFTALILFIFSKRGAFKQTYSNNADMMQRLALVAVTFATALFFGFFISNADAEWSANRYNSEISKNGIYSFFAAFRNNQIKYKDFYTTIDNNKAFAIVKNKIKS